MASFKDISKEDFAKIETFSQDQLDGMLERHLKMMTDEQAYSIKPSDMVEFQKVMPPGVVRDYLTSAGRNKLKKNEALGKKASVKKESPAISVVKSPKEIEKAEAKAKAEAEAKAKAEAKGEDGK